MVTDNLKGKPAEIDPSGLNPVDFFRKPIGVDTEPWQKVDPEVLVRMVQTALSQLRDTARILEENNERPIWTSGKIDQDDNLPAEILTLPSEGLELVRVFDKRDRTGVYRFETPDKSFIALSRLTDESIVLTIFEPKREWSCSLIFDNGSFEFRLSSDRNFADGSKVNRTVCIENLELVLPSNFELDSMAIVATVVHDSTLRIPKRGVINVQRYFDAKVRTEHGEQIISFDKSEVSVGQDILFGFDLDEEVKALTSADMDGVNSALVKLCLAMGINQITEIELQCLLDELDIRFEVVD